MRVDASVWTLSPHFRRLSEEALVPNATSYVRASLCAAKLTTGQKRADSLLTPASEIRLL